ncbi:MAG TPA: aspartate aminotransferase family protein [Bacteroidetes bacterium]|nr:aspartate aminotransferase family protein [Bacteroidota bacterium]
MIFKKKDPSEGKQNIIELTHQHVSSGKVGFYEKYKIDMVMGRREGPWLHDMDGKKKLFNLHSNGGVFNLGHRNKEIINLLIEQLNYYDIGNHHLPSKPRAELAQKMAELMPGNLDYTIFGVSGGEAVDLAIKIARGYTKRKKTVSIKGGYHGHTGLAVQAGDAKYRSPFLLQSDDFLQIPFNDINSLKEVLNENIAAFILETIPATLGMPMPANNYLKEAKKLCEKNGTLLILDEVQTGLGRTGKLWAFEHYDVIPDIVVLAKGLSGGIYPMSATVIDKKLETVFHDDPFVHISTSGGAEIGCVITKRVLEISSNPAFLERVNNLSKIFKTELEKLQLKHHKFFKGIRQKGLMMGLELKDEWAGPVFTKAAFDNDLLIVYANNDSSVVQFLPPLIMQEKEVAFVVQQLDKAMRQAKKLHMAVKLKDNIYSTFIGFVH